MMKKNKKSKVIHFYTRDYNSYFPSKDSPYYFLAGWSSQVARQVLKYTDKYIMENWRFEKEIQHPQKKVVENIPCWLFPARHYPIIGLFSRNLVKSLKKEIRKNEVILHIHTAHNMMSYLLAYVFRNIPVVVSNYGSAPPIFSRSDKKKIKYYIENFIEKRILKYYNYFFPTGKDERDYLSKYVPVEKISKTMGLGIDFEKMKPFNKLEARKKLGIPLKKKVMLYVGKFYKLKGVNYILDSYKQLQKKFDVQLILIGGSKNDELYHEARESRATIFSRMDNQKELPLYYSAADVYLMLVFGGKKFLRFGGIGIAPLESLGCNTPVVGPSMRHFPSSDLERVGKIPESSEDVTKCVAEIFENQERYSNSRDIVKKYYDWEKISKNIVDVYDKLFKEYYN